jgi:hypothetical protein
MRADVALPSSPSRVAPAQLSRTYSRFFYRFSPGTNKHRIIGSCPFSLRQACCSPASCLAGFARRVLRPMRATFYVPCVLRCPCALMRAATYAQSSIQLRYNHSVPPFASPARTQRDLRARKAVGSVRRTRPVSSCSSRRELSVPAELPPSIRLHFITPHIAALKLELALRPGRRVVSGTALVFAKSQYCVSKYSCSGHDHAMSMTPPGSPH